MVQQTSELDEPLITCDRLVRLGRWNVIKGIGHVGVVVEDLHETLELYERVFHLKAAAVKDAMDGSLRVAFIPVGDGEIELIQPMDPNSPFSEFLRARGQGVHHIALTTDNMDTEIDRMKAEGVVFDTEEPRTGAHGVRIIFTQPHTTAGVTHELCAEHWPSSSR